MSHYNSAVIPKHIAASLPNINLLRQVLPLNLTELDASVHLVRAAWNEASVWPKKVNRTYRYGPNISLKTAAGFPFHWIYAAKETLTAIWEAQLCTNPITHPGRFTLELGAEKAFIANLSFDRTLRLFDLSGEAASKLGIYDQLRSPDYEWCQWFGFQIDQVLSEQSEKVHGFVYPSRRHPSSLAYAISSRVHAELAKSLVSPMQEFEKTQEYSELISDPCFIKREDL